MTRTEELLALAKAATPGPWIEAGDGGGDNLGADGKPIKYDSVFYDRPDDLDDYDSVCRDTTHEDSMFIAAANPETIKQLVELCRLQHEALKWAAEVDSAYDGEPADELTEAIAAFNRFEKGGE